MTSTKISISAGSPYDDDLLQRAHRTTVGFLQGLFWARPRGSFCWSPVDEETEVYIAGDSEPAKGRKVPAIHVVLGTAAWAGLSIDTATDTNLLQNSYTFDEAVNSTFVISCVAQSDFDARYLGWLCFRGLAAHKRIIQAKGTIRAIHNVFQLSSVIPADRIDKAYASAKAVQIVLPFTVQCTLAVSDANLDYKALLDKITTRMEQV